MDFLVYNILGIIISLSVVMVLAGVIICIFLPKRIGGKIKWGKRRISSLSLGLPLILAGMIILLFHLEIIINRRRRIDYTEKVKYYLWSYKRYIIAGGKHKSDRITVHDDLRVILNDNQLILNDRDGWRSNSKWASYKGEPVAFYGPNADKVRILARWHMSSTYYLSPLYLHQPDGTVIKLTDGVKETEYKLLAKPEQPFFDETYEINR
jgi:hypothetical protein